MYEIGEHVVKYLDGVCRIESILHLDISGADKNKLYYLLVPIGDKNKKIYVPVDASHAIVRTVMSEEQAQQLIEEIPDIEEIWVDNERLREQHYKDAVKSCRPEALVGIIKSTYSRKKKRLAQKKKCTAVDEKYFQLAEDHLYSELGFVLHRDKSTIASLIADSAKRKELA